MFHDADWVNPQVEIQAKLVLEIKPLCISQNTKHILGRFRLRFTIENTETEEQILVEPSFTYSKS